MYEEPINYELDYEERKIHMDKLYTVLMGDPKCKSNQMQGILRVPFCKYRSDNLGEKIVTLEKID